ncbi:hypothetical protein HQ520_13875, partial [bacterium]|nr:hypothetical protein [bacterium]
MDQVTFERLEFPRVLEHVAEFAVSRAAKQAVLGTMPWTEGGELGRQWDGVMEVLGVLDRGGSLPLAGFDDCGETLARLAKPHGFLEAEEWLGLRAFLGIAAEVRHLIEHNREQMPACWGEAGRIGALPEVRREIDRVFDLEGNVRDGASEDLKRCRGQIRRLEREVEKSINGLLNSLGKADVLRESYWTIRAGRRVLPVRAANRGRVPGIVHDVSNTGETIFVEPIELIEPTNRLAEEQNREREIIIRILSELASETRQYAPELSRNRQILVQVDLWHARARLAYRHSLHRPDIHADRSLRLVQAHHPLLYFQDPKRSMPMDMALDAENRALIITGPNTGGKTTALKTVGLLILMTQCAIPVPLGLDSRVPLFRQVLAEIGDEQSVSAGLSTFSAHIRRISTIIRQCGVDSLVLLDELGKATDPLQAGALGRAILEALIERGALTFVTTHLPTLKDWAHDSPAGRNASFRLDPRTHRPQYQLQLDTPGISEAFMIAEAEGLPHEIVERAKEQLPTEERKMNELLATLQDREQLLEREKRKAQHAREKANSERREFRKRRAETEKRKADLDLRLEQEYKQLLDRARQDIEKRIANLPSRQAISQARLQLERDQRSTQRRIESIRRREEQILQSSEPPAEEEKEPYQPAVGDWV